MTVPLSLTSVFFLNTIPILSVLTGCTLTCDATTSLKQPYSCNCYVLLIKNDDNLSADRTYLPTDTCVGLQMIPRIQNQSSPGKPERCPHDIRRDNNKLYNLL